MKADKDFPFRLFFCNRMAACPDMSLKIRAAIPVAFGWHLVVTYWKIAG